MLRSGPHLKSVCRTSASSTYTVHIALRPVVVLDMYRVGTPYSYSLRRWSNTAFCATTYPDIILFLYFASVDVIFCTYNLGSIDVVYHALII